MTDWETLRQIIPLNKLVELEYQPQILPGINYAVNKYLSRYDQFKDLQDTIMEVDFTNEVTRPTKQLSKYLYERHNITIDAATLAEVGNVAEMYKVRDSGKIIFSITNCFDWDAGDFGDDGSCFWDGCESNRVALEDSGGLAFRIHNSFRPVLQVGKARCWLYPTMKSGFITAFNGYGMDLRQLVKFLAIKLNMFSRNIRLESDIYINNGSGFILGTDEHIFKLTGINHCGISFPEEEGYYDD